MIVHVGKNIFRFIKTGNFYEVFEKTEFDNWEFLGIAKNTNVLNMFIDSVRKETKDVHHSP